jgi:hypothetical protein
MTSRIDEICPPYVKARRLTLELTAAKTNPTAHKSLLVNVTYDQTSPQGVMVPLVMVVQGPSQRSYQERVFRGRPPTQLVVTPREGGKHLVSLRELYHNRWWGAVEFEVVGDLLTG